MLSTDEGLHIGGAVQHGQQTGERHVREQELVRVQGVHSQQTLAHVHESLRDSNNEELVLS